ncbi:MAG: GNAT family N-acetyltransferase [Bacillota bacterium]|nr:GNAT family N-acetyltransferase [Bacillota bacterium]
MARLTEEELPDLAKFDCGDEKMNCFLKDEAFDEQERGMNSTILLYYEGALVAFCSICSDSIRLSREEREAEGVSYYKVPAIKIARLGRDIRFRGRYFGAWLVEYVKGLAFRLSKTQLGVRFITLDAYPDRVKYYESLGFMQNEEESRRRSCSTVSMRADVFD